MNQNIKIDLVSESDAPELLEIYRPYVEKTAITFEYAVPSVEEFTNRIRTISKKYPYLKAISTSGKISGYAYAGCFKSRPAYDWSVETSIYIEESARHTGIGRLLYNELENRLLKMGIQNMNACITYPEVEDQFLTKDSVKFHEKMGFKPVGIFHNCGCKFGRWYHMTWMEKLIGNHPENPPEVNFGKY